jgi:hypothetical protein
VHSVYRRFWGSFPDLAGAATTTVFDTRIVRGRILTGADPEDQEKGRRVVRAQRDRPLFVFAGIWTEFKGDRGTKSKPVPGPISSTGF